MALFTFLMRVIIAICVAMFLSSVGGTQPLQQQVEYNRLVELAGSDKQMDSLIKMTTYIDRGINPNMKDDKDFKTALISATFAGNFEIVKLLVKRAKAQVDLTEDRFGLSPLMVASINGYIEIADFLISNGASTELKETSYDGSTALLYAINEGSLPMTKLLLEKGKANVNSADTKFGNNALMVASLRGHLDIVNYLLFQFVPAINQASININARNFDGKTARELAEGLGNNEIVDLIDKKMGVVRADSDVDNDNYIDNDIVSIESSTRLEASSITTTVGSSSDKSAEPSSSSSSSSSSITSTTTISPSSLSGGSTTTISSRKILCQETENSFDICEEYEQTNSDIITQSDEDIGNILKTKVNVVFTLDEVNSFVSAASNKDLNTINGFINRGIDVNEKDHLGSTALILASFYGHLDVVSLLLYQGANPNLTNKYGYSALHFAASNGYLEIASQLVLRQADCSLISDFGDSALLFAAYKGNKEMVEFLLINGASKVIHSQDHKGNSALSLAKDKKHNQVVELLESFINRNI